MRLHVKALEVLDPSRPFIGWTKKMLHKFTQDCNLHSTQIHRKVSRGCSMHLSAHCSGPVVSHPGGCESVWFPLLLDDVPEVVASWRSSRAYSRDLGALGGPAGPYAPVEA